MLKTHIDRDRMDVKSLERKIDDQKRKLNATVDDIVQLDAVLGGPKGNNSVFNNGSDDIKIHGLEQEVEELKKANRTLQEEKE